MLKIVKYAVLGMNAGFTTYRRTKNDIIFTQEAVLITAHGKFCNILFCCMILCELLQ